MKYVAIIDDAFLENFRLDDNGQTLVVNDRSYSERALSLISLRKPLFIKENDGKYAYITRGHIDAMREYEKQEMLRRQRETVIDSLKLLNEMLKEGGYDN